MNPQPALEDLVLGAGPMKHIMIKRFVDVEVLSQGDNAFCQRAKRVSSNFTSVKT